LGADIVVHSATKYLSGHNSVIGGICVVKSEKLFKDLKFLQKSMGAVSSPFDCWLTLHGIKTLTVRMDRHCESAMKVAQYLNDHPKVKSVVYPGLPNHPQHEVAARQMKGFGGMISFELDGGFDAGVKLLNGLSMISLAESLGAVESMITHPASMTHPDVPRDVRLARGLTDGLVRLSVGIEAVEDIIEDLDSSLSKL
jgi:cystathionine beta-lyase/cystathionine gamma-synthase